MTEQSSRTSPRPPRHAEDHDDAPRGAPPRGLALDPPIPTPAHDPEIPADRLDQDALRVVYRLRHMGHKAYFVGGCVRDLLVGVKPKDFDLATDAHPGEVRAIFRNCRLIGRRFRLAHVYFRDGKVIEVATFRKNPTDTTEEGAEAGDLLITHDNVFGTAEEDAVRRDFTVNGLFYDPATGEVIDYVNGRADLAAQRIGTIGDPEVRMREDPVRALRAVRFAARLGFAIAPDTFEAMRRHAGELSRCAPARVLEEIFKLLRCGGSVRAFALLRACGALPLILPALATAHDGWDEPQRKRFMAHLGALDRLVKSGTEVPESVLLGTLLVHLGAPALEVAPGADPDEEHEAPEEGDGTTTVHHLRSAPAAEALLEQLVQTSRLPRKVAERIRMALHAQSIFRDPRPKTRRRRRGRGITAQPYFADALMLLRISAEATGEGVDVYHRWAAEAARNPAPPPERSERGGRGGRGDRHPRQGGSRRGPAGQPGQPGQERGGAEHVRHQRPQDRIIDLGPGAETSQPEAARTSGTVEITVDGVFGAAPAEPGGDAPGRRPRRGGRRRRRRGGGGGGGGRAPGEGGPPPAPPA